MSAPRNLRIAAAISVLILVGCASGQAVYLEGPNGQTAQCGPAYYHLGFPMERSQETDEELLRKCIADYEGRGFRQVPAPPKEQTGDADHDEMIIG